jgi:hypothetical protein
MRHAVFVAPFPLEAALRPGGGGPGRRSKAEDLVNDRFPGHFVGRLLESPR